MSMVTSSGPTLKHVSFVYLYIYVWLVTHSHPLSTASLSIRRSITVAPPFGSQIFYRLKLLETLIHQRPYSQTFSRKGTPEQNH